MSQVGVYLVSDVLLRGQGNQKRSLNDKYVIVASKRSGGLCRPMGRSPVPPPLAILAFRLKAARERKQLTLQEVYDLTGVHVGRLESNRANMTVMTLLTLCRFYEVQPAEIVAGLDEMLED